MGYRSGGVDVEIPDMIDHRPPRLADGRGVALKDPLDERLLLR
jgi:hypothetical protein